MGIKAPTIISPGYKTLKHVSVGTARPIVSIVEISSNRLRGRSDRFRNIYSWYCRIRSIAGNKHTCAEVGIKISNLIEKRDFIFFYNIDMF